MNLKYFKLKQKALIPIQCAYHDPATDKVFQPLLNETFESFLSKILAYRTEAGLEPYSKAELEIYIHSVLYETCPAEKRSIYFREVTVMPQISEVLGAVRAIVRHNVKKKSTVAAQTSKQELASRIETCLGCPLHNEKGGGGKRLNDYGQRVMSAFIQQADKIDNSKLGTCKLCGCGMGHKVLATLSNSIKSLNIKQIEAYYSIVGPAGFENTCWIIEGALNQPKDNKIKEAWQRIRKRENLA